jgi:hypothetical protein
MLIPVLKIGRRVESHVLQRADHNRSEGLVEDYSYSFLPFGPALTIFQAEYMLNNAQEPRPRNRSFLEQFSRPAAIRGYRVLSDLFNPPELRFAD